MTPETSTADAEAAARLIAYGMRTRQLPARDLDYLRLTRLYRHDLAFRTLTDQVGRGLGLSVLGTDSATEALVLAALDGSLFETRIEDYARLAKHRGSFAAHEKVLHGLIHLAVAALAFPRPDDLAQDDFVGRVNVDIVESTLRDACRKLELKAAEAAGEDESPSETPELEEVWRVYARRPETARTKGNGTPVNSTRAMIGRALNFLTESGFLNPVGEPKEGNYRTTPRYQLQVRELAATRAFQELLTLGAVPMTGADGTLRVLPEDHRVELTLETADV
ncbi:hypothetical protein CFP65_1389 [Kitasatospora sp. MMS16-BH015]|uniref:hypothetical protein n=1 Tax=Kitasatospora sp. MMS16-BH015 TaxID=2018025 RepID=UPI000CA20491|nr:hypothetical protein [Kitasatospora sp. MMS16-BH015]AUG76288.1 hypothetical protein CFP65_1389 [Kitasatospora sp. MMS16-BH015]